MKQTTQATQMHTTQPSRSQAHLQWRAIAGRAAAAALALSTVVAGMGLAMPAYADFADGRSGRDVILGKDNDNVGNLVIQPAELPSPPGADQSLNRTDIQLGGSGGDVLIGSFGDDVQLGESGDDVFIGGPEGGPAPGGPPNSDVQIGGSGSDVSIWAPGDGSDFFHGGSGRDAQVVGLIDRVDVTPPLQGGQSVKLNPASGYQSGLPGVNVAGLNAQCTIEKVQAESELGYEFLVRFRNAAGTIVVTLRQVDVEQVFCPSSNGQAAQGIVFADLRQDAPSFRPVTIDEVRQLNSLVGQIIR